MAALVVYGDLVTKRLAVALWSTERYQLVGRSVDIGVVYNRLGAFSTHVGRLTWELNVAGTIVAVLLAMACCRRLAVIDRGAPAIMGLVAGAGLGNLTSLVSSNAGVPDFLAVTTDASHGVVLNVADIAAMIGIAGLARMVVLLLLALASRTRRIAPPAAG